MRSLPSTATRTIKVRRKGTECALADVKMHVASCRVRLLPTRHDPACRGEEPVDCWVMRTWEADPPEGVQPIEWILCTSLPCESLEAAVRVVELYARNAFDFTRSRACDRPATLLVGYSQVLLTDAYGGYDGVVAGNGMTHAGCCAHARRKFIDAESSDAAMAREAVAAVDARFAIERRVKASAKGAAPEDLAAVRERESRALTTHLHGRLLRWKADLPPRSPHVHTETGAVQHVLNQWAELSVSLDDPAMPITFDSHLG